jgi:hypothetical protein
MLCSFILQKFYQLSLGYILFKAADKAVIFNQLLGL